MPKPAGGVFTPLPNWLVRSSRAAEICAKVSMKGTLAGVEIISWSAATTLADARKSKSPALLSREMSPPAAPLSWALSRPSMPINFPAASAVTVMLPADALMLAALSRAFVTTTLSLIEVRPMSPMLEVIDSATTSP